MALPHPADEQASAFKRPPDLAQLLGISDDAAEDYSLAGRLSLIARLKAAKRIEAARGQARSWLYDVNRHLSLCAALRAEYESLGEFIGRQHERGGHAADEESPFEAAAPHGL